MKKTTLFLLSSACLVAGCYSSPEMNENKYKDQYATTPDACKSSGTYQHEGLRRCLENAMAADEANKKTVKIYEQKDGSALVVPRTFDDGDMAEANRVYEVVDVRSNAVMIEDGTSPAESKVTQTTVTTTVVETQKTQTSSQTKEEEAVALTDVPQESVEGFEAIEIIEDENAALDEADVPVIESVEEASDASVDETAVVDSVVEDNSVQETEAAAEEEMAEPVESTQKGSAFSNEVTLVVGPLKEELVISVKSAKDAQNQEASQKTTEPAVPEQKVEKEVLPLEEK